MVVAELAAEQIRGAAIDASRPSALEVAEELFLEIEAGSSGRPNQAREIQNMQQMAPLLTQLLQTCAAVLSG